MRFNSVVYITDIPPPVIYGSIGCLKSGDPVMTNIPKDEVDRMPGETMAEKCAWAARKQLNYMFAVKLGASPECTASQDTAINILDKAKEGTCKGNERQLFFVGGMCGSVAVPTATSFPGSLIFPLQD